MLEPLVILLAFIAGLVFKRLGYPPLLGYLLAGFIAHALNLGSAEVIAPIADIGIALLLFTIGLKLNIKELMAPQVWGAAILQMGITIPLTALVITLLASFIPALAISSASAAWVLAFALSFSSTVFAVKIFSERGESATLHASIAIGVLVIQDVIAVSYLVFTSEIPPSPYALGLLLLPLLRPLMLRLMTLAGHGELLVLFGICVALVTGQLFDWLHLKSGLGALVAGILLSNTGKSAELYKDLINFKDLFLIGFFVNVGYSGLPTLSMFLISVALGFVLFLRPLIYSALFVLFRLRARTAVLAGLSLFSYSEFGLIVVSLCVANGTLASEWITTLALALAMSFFIAIPFNTRVHQFYAKYAHILRKFERPQCLASEEPVDLKDAKVLICGMGRVGVGAYELLSTRYPDNVVGIEAGVERAKSHVKSGINCVAGDASDRDFWDRVNMDSRELILVGLSNHRENVEVVTLLQNLGYKGQLAVVSVFDDEQEQLQAMGCIAFNLYAEVGYGFAEHVLEQADKNEPLSYQI